MNHYLGKIEFIFFKNPVFLSQCLFMKDKIILLFSQSKLDQDINSEENLLHLSILILNLD